MIYAIRWYDTRDLPVIGVPACSECGAFPWELTSTRCLYGPFTHSPSENVAAGLMHSHKPNGDIWVGKHARVAWNGSPALRRWWGSVERYSQHSSFYASRLYRGLNGKQFAQSYWRYMEDHKDELDRLIHE